MSGPGRPRKPAGERLELLSIRIHPKALNNALTYPPAIRRKLVEDAYIKPYESKVIKELK